MEVSTRYRGRTVTPEDVRFIRELIATHPAASRRASPSSIDRLMCLSYVLGIEGALRPEAVMYDPIDGSRSLP